MKKLFVLSFLLISMVLTAQDGFKIDFKIKGIKDTIAYLGNYYGESTYLVDTTRANSKGEFTFLGKKPLPHGVYLLIFKNGKESLKVFDLVMGTDQTFSIETSTDDYLGNVKVTGDEDNHLFFSNIKHNIERGKEADPYVKTIQDSTILEGNKKEAREAFTNISTSPMR